MTSKPVGFIGLGQMGRGMALNLAKAVDALCVFDLSSDAMAALAAAGAIQSAGPRAVAQTCDLIFLCLPSASHSRSVIFGPDGLQASAAGGLTIVDTTTLDRTDAIAIAREAADAGIAYWDCPVSGLPQRADDGTLTVLFGGSKAAFDMAKPFLEAIGEEIVHCGPVGCGQAMKAINNILYDVNIAALCEVLPLAVAVGLEPEAVGRVVTTASGRSFASTHFVPRMLENCFDKDFTLNGAYKDIVNVQHMAIETRASLPVVNAMISSYQSAIAAGFGDEPKSAMLKVYEKALGVAFRRGRPEE